MVERGEQGKLKKGSVLNPKGRPKKEKEHDYLKIMLNIVTPTHWKIIVEKAMSQAEKGDPTARKWLADYIIGQPAQKVEHTGDKGGPLEILVTYDDYPNQDAPTAPGPG